MFQKLFSRWIARIYDALEAEKLRRDKAILEKKLAEKDAQARKNAQFLLAEIAKKQENCNHLKGGGRGAYRDYNVRTHIFPDQRMVVKCCICGKEWSKENSNLKLGLEFAKQSTNTTSASEVSLGRYKDRDKVLTDVEVAVEEAHNERLNKSEWQSQIDNSPLGPWAGPKWPSIWAKAEAKLKRLAARKKKTLDKKKETVVG